VEKLLSERGCVRGRLNGFTPRQVWPLRREGDGSGSVGRLGTEISKVGSGCSKWPGKSNSSWFFNCANRELVTVSASSTLPLLSHSVARPAERRRIPSLKDGRFTAFWCV